MQNNESSRPVDYGIESQTLHYHDISRRKLHEIKLATVYTVIQQPDQLLQDAEARNSRRKKVHVDDGKTSGLLALQLQRARHISQVLPLQSTMPNKENKHRRASKQASQSNEFHGTLGAPYQTSKGYNLLFHKGTNGLGAPRGTTDDMTEKPYRNPSRTQNLSIELE